MVYGLQGLQGVGLRVWGSWFKAYSSATLQEGVR